MNSSDYASLAQELFKAESSGIQTSLLNQRYPDMTMSDAYSIQNELYRLKLSSGCSVIGWKIGLTSQAMRSALGIDIPDSGILFDNMLFPSGSTIEQGRFIEPRIEAEIAFVMRTGLPSNATRQDIISATDYVTPALEILDTRIIRTDSVTGNSRTIFDTISDNAANAGIVLGEFQHDIESFDLRRVGSIVSRNGEVEETGLGAGVLNDPIESLVWLSRRMSDYGQRIESGHIILSGSFVRPIECPSGTIINADFADFGTIDLSFA